MCDGMHFYVHIAVSVEQNAYRKYPAVIFFSTIVELVPSSFIAQVVV